MHHLRIKTICCVYSVLFLFLIGPFGYASEGARTIASYDMAAAPNNAKELVDSGPFHYNGVIHGDVHFGPGNSGQALIFNGQKESFVRIENAPEVNRALTNSFSISAWIRPDGLPSPGSSFAGIISTHDANWHPFSIALGLDHEGHIIFQCDDNSSSARTSQLKTGVWQHVAVTYETGGERIVYLNGIAVDSCHAPAPCNASTEGLWFGREVDSGFQGALGRVTIYEGVLTPDQVDADMKGNMAVPPATVADIPFPLHRVHLYLTRFDQPLGLKTDYAPTRQNAKRAPGPNAVDWPTITVAGQPVFAKGSNEDILLPLRGAGGLEEPDGGKFNSVLKVDGDAAVSPGDHWLRVVSWLWNRKDVYTVDSTARGSNDITPPDYELFAFPVVIKSPQKGQLHSVTLTSGGQTVYQRQEDLDSLMLLLPAAEYQLQVNGSAPQSLVAGLQPVEIGNPRDLMRPVDLSYANGITVSLPSQAEAFTEQGEWNADVARMTQCASNPMATPGGTNRPAPEPFVDIPSSPIQIHGIDMSHGMSGGWFGGSAHGPAFSGNLDAFANHLADLGYDQVTSESQPGWERENGATEQWLNALAKRGIKGGVYPLTLADSNLPIFYYDLADYRAPKYRDMQLVVQRFAPYHNFLGTYFGGDNGGYCRFWDWSPPKTRWAEAFETLISGAQSVPIGPQISTGLQPFEHRDTEKNFLDYVTKYNQMFGTYGQLAQAATEILPHAMVTIGSYGSSPGVLGHGGWPDGTAPGNLMFDKMPVQLAYDWNELNTSKPMHLVAQLDRLISYHPTTPTWAQVDEFRLFFGREARQRAYALALTRGITSIGGNFLANGQPFEDYGPTSSSAGSPDKINDYRDLFKWVHTYGGAYAGTKPDAKIAILFVEDQAISRSINNPVNRGSQEGKATEALFICHAAGWPAKIVTPEELRRGLDPSITALLLVGLNKIDDTWVWYNGLEDDLQRFTKQGGKILVDDESVSPLPAVQTGMSVLAYLTQRNCPPDVSPSIELFNRNQKNIGLLQKAMGGTTPPIAASGSQTIWAVPHTTGDINYVTVVNWGYKPGTNADQIVLPQTGALSWHTDRPIYDVHQMRLLSPAEASQVDLTKDGFCLYALPPKPVGKPILTLHGTTATVDVNGFHGVPLRIDIKSDNQTRTVFAASGAPVMLPAQVNAQNQVCATELLSGQTSDSQVQDVTSATTTPDDALTEKLSHFYERKDVPVVVALTSAQAADAKIVALANRVVDLLKQKGRVARIGNADPTDVVQSIQIAESMNQYPKWQTANVDLVLFGSAANNLLIFDQERGCLLPHAVGGQTIVTFSPFVGGYEVLNVLGTDSDQLAATVDHL